MDYRERFQGMIDEYNSGSLNVEEFSSRLMAFAKSLTQGEQLSVGEKLSEEELALKPEMELSRRERAQVKKTSRALLATLKHEKLVLDWRKRQQAQVTIETVAGPRAAASVHAGGLSGEERSCVPAHL